MKSRITKLLGRDKSPRAAFAGSVRVARGEPSGEPPGPTWKFPDESKPRSFYVPPIMLDCSRPATPAPTAVAAPPIAHATDAAPEKTTGAKAVPPIDRFWGASIRLFQVDVLVVYVWPTLVADRRQRGELLATFQTRFARPIVLAALDDKNVATYFGPGPIAKVLARIPFEALAWRKYRFAIPSPMMLPIPPEPPPDDSGESSGGAGAYRYSYLATAIRDRDQEETRP
jgi:hypothetical protein